MEESGAVRARSPAQQNQRNHTELLSTKPLHRLVRRDPKSLGVVLVAFGWAELVFGFVMAGLGAEFRTSALFYTPFWQGALFIISGSLSVYTGMQPSKKMVTVCLSLYVVAVFGIIVSFGFRIVSFSWLNYALYRNSQQQCIHILITLEVLLFLSSMCVSALLIFMCVVARLALKSTRTQIILHQIQPPETVTPTQEN